MKQSVKQKIIYFGGAVAVGVASFVAGACTSAAIVSGVARPSVVVPVAPQHAYGGAVSGGNIHDIRDFGAWVNDSATEIDYFAVALHKPSRYWTGNFDYDTQKLNSSKAHAYDELVSAGLEEDWQLMTGSAMTQSSYFYHAITFSSNTENVFLHGSQYTARTFVVPMIVQTPGQAQMAMWMHFHENNITVQMASATANTWNAVSFDFLANYTGSVTVCMAIPIAAMGQTPTLNLVRVEKDSGPVANAPVTTTVTSAYLGQNRNDTFKVRGDYTLQDTIDAYENGYSDGAEEANEINENTTGVFGILGSAFSSVAAVLNIRVFGFMTIGSFLAVPLVVLVVVAVFKLLRG